MGEVLAAFLWSRRGRSPARVWSRHLPIRLCQTKTGGTASQTAEIRFYAAGHRHFADRMSQSA